MRNKIISRLKSKRRSEGNVLEAYYFHNSDIAEIMKNIDKFEEVLLLDLFGCLHKEVIELKKSIEKTFRIKNEDKEEIFEQDSLPMW